MACRADERKKRGEWGKRTVQQRPADTEERSTDSRHVPGDRRCPGSPSLPLRPRNPGFSVTRHSASVSY